MGPLSSDTGDHITTLFSNGIYAMEAGVYDSSPAESVITLRSNNSWSPKIEIPTEGNVYFNNTGKFGIGTTSPSEQLSITSGASTRTELLMSDGNTASLMLAAGNSTDGVLASDVALQFRTGVTYPSADTGGVTAMTILASGDVGIGTTNPTYPLAVNGTVEAKEVIVQTGWSDYVFENGYHLTPLNEVERTIKSQKHLPGMPSSAEVAEHGVNLGDMQAKLLAQVEELTLHQIEQEKLIKEQQLKMKELERKIWSLENDNH